MQLSYKGGGVYIQSPTVSIIFKLCILILPAAIHYSLLFDKPNLTPVMQSVPDAETDS